MALPPEHTTWIARVSAARVRSWPFLAASAARTVGVTLALAPGLVWLWSPVLPDALWTALPAGPMVAAGIVLALVAGRAEAVTGARAARTVGAAPDDLDAVGLRGLIQQHTAWTRAWHQAAARACFSDAPAQGGVAAALWLAGRVLLIAVAAGIVLAITGGALTVG